MERQCIVHNAVFFRGRLYLIDTDADRKKGKSSPSTSKQQQQQNQQRRAPPAAASDLVDLVDPAAVPGPSTAAALRQSAALLGQVELAPEFKEARFKKYAVVGRDELRRTVLGRTGGAAEGGGASSGGSGSGGGGGKKKGERQQGGRGAAWNGTVTFFEAAVTWHRFQMQYYYHILGGCTIKPLYLRWVDAAGRGCLWAARG